MRPVALDQVHLEDQRLEFRTDHNPFEIDDMLDQFAVLGEWSAPAWKYDRTRERRLIALPT